MKSKKQIHILYEDEYIIAINKPPRVATVPADHIPINKTVLGTMLREFAGSGFSPYVLHRLDAQTSGVLLFGKHEKDRAVLETIFKHPDAQKAYIALVLGYPHGKSITRNLKARSSNVEVFAQTDYRVLQVFKGKIPTFSLVEAIIKTGRKHQIRQHFAGIGHPILMDDRYGDPQMNRKFRIRFRLGRQFLHAAQITFFHPILQKKITIQAPLTMDLQSTLKKLQSAQ